MRRTLASVWWLVSLAACATATAAAPEGPKPATATALARDVGRGEAIFARTCGKCHTTADTTYAPSVANEGLDEAALHDRIRRGGGGPRNVYMDMAPIDEAKLPEADLPDLYAFLRTKRTLR
jgi:mono/diheme cytochrome c family protein